MPHKHLSQRLGDNARITRAFSGAGSMAIFKPKVTRECKRHHTVEGEAMITRQLTREVMRGPTDPPFSSDRSPLMDSLGDLRVRKVP